MTRTSGICVHAKDSFSFSDKHWLDDQFILHFLDRIDHQDRTNNMDQMEIASPTVALCIKVSSDSSVIRG